MTEMHFKKYYLHEYSEDFVSFIYSKFKFGETASIFRISEEIVNYINEHISINERSYFLAIFKDIPSSSYYLTQNVVDALNKSSGNKKHADVLYGKRLQDPLDSYSSIHYKQRSNYKMNEVHMDISKIEKLDSQIIIIDDAYVSGAFTDFISGYLGSLGFTNVTFVYFVRFPEKSLNQYPYLEFDVNHYHIKTLKDIVEISGEGKIMITRKLVKLILDSNNRDIKDFIKCTDLKFHLQLLKYIDDDMKRDLCKDEQTNADNIINLIKKAVNK